MPRKVNRDPSLDVDWNGQADAALAEAKLLPEGPAREALLRKARQLKEASHMKDWLSSPGLKPPV